jgi:hypothetical protein
MSLIVLQLILDERSSKIVGLALCGVAPSGSSKSFPIWVALMSGLFAVIREVANLYAPTQTPLWNKSVFWACVWVTFVVSSITAWYLKHRDLIEEKAKNSKPDIQGGIPEVYTDRAMDSPLTPGTELG